MNTSFAGRTVMGLMVLAGLVAVFSEPALGQVTEAWVRRYGGGSARAVAVDGGGNVIVAGASGIGGAANYTTIKYSATGEAIWTNSYDGPAGGEDVVLDLVVDANGNTFVTGNSSQLPGSSSFTDIGTIAYSGAGAALWTNRYGGTVAAAATDAAGNLYLAGYYGAGSGSDYLTIKYSSAGTLLWTNRYNTPADGPDIATAMVLDDGGNVYVTGFSYGGNTTTNYDYATVAYSTDGMPLWTNRYNGPYGPDLATDIAADNNGNVFVTGYSYNPDLSYSYATVAYSATGLPLWTNRYVGPVSDDSRAQAVAVDTNGNVFVTGYSFGFSNYDFATIKYSSNGLALWTNRYNPPAWSSVDKASAMAVDSEGSVVVIGFSSNTNGNLDYVTLKYSGSGVALWTNRYDGPSHGSDQPSSLAIGPGNEVYVTGSSGNDFATIKYLGVAALPVVLGIEKAGGQVVLSWTNAGLSLQTAPSLTALFTNIPGATSPYTNAIVGGQIYFRLQAN